MSMSKYASKAHYDADEPTRIADWLESPQCGLLGDERVQRAAALLRKLAVPEVVAPYDQSALDAASREVHMMLLREGSSWGTKACEEMGRVFMTAYLKALPSPQRRVEGKWCEATEAFTCTTLADCNDGGCRRLRRDTGGEPQHSSPKE